MSSCRKAETRGFALENAIANNEIEEIEFTPAMPALLERAIRENMLCCTQKVLLARLFSLLTSSGSEKFAPRHSRPRVLGS